MKTLDLKNINENKKKIATNPNRLKKDCYSKGITILSCVITVIILLILSGITINQINSDNGLIEKSKLAKKVAEESNEKEALQMEIMQKNISDESDSDTNNIGQPLYDRNVENGDKWNIIVDNKNSRQYGTGYNYIPQGTEINNYGTAKYSWIINYQTGEIIKIDEDYTFLSYKSTLAINDGLVFNMDAVNVSNEQEDWGKNVSLYYYDDTKYDTIQKRKEEYTKQNKYESVTEFDGYDRQKTNDFKNFIDSENKAFKFNGNNYIEIYNENGFDFSKGFTIEFYGKIDKEIKGATEPQIPFIGIVGLWTGKYKDICKMRLGSANSRYLLYSLYNGGVENKGSWSMLEDAPWNQYYEGNFLEREQYITIEFEPRKNARTVQRIYVDGNLLAEGWLEECYWKSFLALNKSFKYIEVGRSNMSSPGNWCYMKGICYATRIYNKTLSQEEIISNYNKTKLHRQTKND